MKDAVKPLAEYQGFTDMLLSFGHHPILGVLIGFAITAIVQSSSASMGMLNSFSISRINTYNSSFTNIIW